MPVLADVVDSIVNPTEFASRKDSQKLQWGLPLSIVLGACLAQFLLSFVMQRAIRGQTYDFLVNSRAGNDVLNLVSHTNTVATFMMFVGSASLLPFWVVGAAVITCVGILLNGRDDFRRLLYLNAFAHLPLICGSLVSVFVLLVWSPHVDSSIPGQITVASAVDDIRSYLDEILRTTPVFLVRVFGYLAQVWAFILFAYNARAVQRLSLFTSSIGAIGYGVFLFGLSWIAS